MKLILSNTAHGAYTGVLEELRKRLSDGGEHVVIVPDKFTASSERGVVSSLGLTATFNVSVTSFTRLAERTIGSLIKRCLTPQGSVMMLAKVIEDRRNELEYYGKAAGVNGFADEFYAALTAVRNSGVTPDALRRAADDAPAFFKDKLHDLSLIYDGYIGALGDKHSDSSTRLEAFAAYLKTSPPLPVHYYVVDFYDFKAPELAVLEGLSESALSLTIGLADGFDNPNARIYCNGVAERVRKVCGGAETVVFNENLNPVSDMISKRLFSYQPPEKRVDCEGRLSLVSARTRADEILSAVTYIKSKVMKGARYKDFEIVLTDPDSYKAELKSAFVRYDVPFFIDTRELLAEQTKVRYLLSAIAVVRSRFSADEVAEFVKNPLFSTDGKLSGEGEEKIKDSASYAGVTPDDVFLFENYVLRYNIDYSRFEAPFLLCGDTDRERKEHEAAERVRGKVCAVTRCFRFERDVDACAFAGAARDFLAGADAAWRIHTEKLTRMSLYYAKCAEQVDEKTDAVLEEMEYVLTAEGNLSYYENILKSALRSVKIALVPTYLDAVFVGDTDSRYVGYGEIIVLGANVGKLPAGKGGGAVLTVKDEELFDALDIGLTPSQKQRIYTELMSVTEIFKKPSRKLVVSYPESSPSGELRPSSVIAELIGMFSENGAPVCVKRTGFDDIPYEECAERAEKVGALLSTPKACFYEILKGADGTGSDELSGVAYMFADKEHKERVDRVYSRQYLPENISLPRTDASENFSSSASRLERYFQCPYAHYLRYILGLNEREKAGFENTDNGTILHAVLEAFFKLVMRGEIDEENMESRVKRIFDDVALSLRRIAVVADQPTVSRRLQRLKEESVSLCEKLFEVGKRSEYSTRYVEEKIGGKEIPPMYLEVDGRRVELKGKIDRVDVLDGKFVVIDYKTYAGADLKLSGIYSGETIQLYVYLNAIADGKGWKPAGVFYLPLSSGFVKEGEKRFKYRGHVIKSVAEASEIDSLFAENPEESVLPYKKPRGKSDDILSADVYFSEEDFAAVASYVAELAKEGVRQITAGRIKPEPLEGACKFCDYAETCQFAEIAPRKRSGDIKISSFYQKDKSGEEAGFADGQSD